MDYVVYGTGYGATLMLLGYAVRTWGPGWRFRPDEEGAYDRREFQSARSSWMRFTTGLGAVIATAGALLVLVTFLLMLWNPGDDVGSTVALVVTGLMLVAVAGWSWLFHDRFGSWGVVAMPNALTSYEPIRYNNAPEQDISLTTASDESLPEDDEPFEDDEESITEEVQLEDDDDEFAARYSKFEVHHPDGEPDDEYVSGDHPEEEDDADAIDLTDVTDDEAYEAQYGKYMSHHPDSIDGVSVDDASSGNDKIEDIEEFVENLSPQEVTEDLIDYSDDEPIEVEGDAADHLGGDDTTTVEPVKIAGEQDPLEVLPEAQGELEPLLGPEPGVDNEEPGGREEALRRLRERRAQRAEHADEDA